VAYLALFGLRRIGKTLLLLEHATRLIASPTHLCYNSVK